MVMVTLKSTIEDKIMNEMQTKIIDLQVKREAFSQLLPRCMSVGDFNSSRLDDIDRVKKLSVLEHARVVYLPNGIVGDVAIVTANHDDLLFVLHVLTSNDVKYAVYFLGNFEAGFEPNAEGML